MSEQSSPGTIDPSLALGNTTVYERALPVEVHGPHNLEDHPDKLHTFVDKTAEEAYMGLVKEWDERAVKDHATPEQTPIATNEGLGLHYPKISLYHGGDTTGITEFEAAGDDTVGHGLYTTSMPDQAFGYAVVRSVQRKKIGDTIFTSGPSPVVYEVEVTDATFLDLRTRANLGVVMKDYVAFLERWHASQQHTEDLSWFNRQYLDIVTEKINTFRQDEDHTPASLKKVLQQTGSLFTEFVTGLGYDGVIALEGGEGGYTGNHDSWVIMDPTTARVTNEVTFLTPVVSDDDAWQAQHAKTDKLFGRPPIIPPKDRATV